MFYKSITVYTLLFSSVQDKVGRGSAYVFKVRLECDLKIIPLPSGQGTAREAEQYHLDFQYIVILSKVLTCYIAVIFVLLDR